MGSIKKILAKAELVDYPSESLEFELNHGPTGGVDIVHLQTDLWRVEITEGEFREFAETVIAATDKLKKIKGVEDS